MDNILKNKGIIRNPKDGEDIVNLSEKSYDFGLDRVGIASVHRVSKFMEMRSDLFATVHGNTPSDEWLILKYNAISNPFIIKEGDILAIPDEFAAKALESNPKKRSLNNPKSDDNKSNIREKFKQLIDFKDRETPNTNTFENFKKKYNNLELERQRANLEALRDGVGGTGTIPGGQGGGSPTEDQLPPTFADGNRGEFTILPNGEVILGTSVAETDESCGKKTTTKAELINSLIKNRVVR